MEKMLLRQKWLGVIVVFVVSLLFSVYSAGRITDAYVQIEPQISKEMNYFLPVTFAGGQIVSPQDAIIERTYGTPENPYTVMLNTKVDELNISDLSGGLYFTRSKVYSYDSSKGEIKIQSLDKVPDVTITAQDVGGFLEQFGGYLKPTLSLIFTVVFASFIGIATLFYTIITHWLFKRLYHADFALTLRVNTLAYSAMFALSFLVDINFGFIVTLLLILACNYLANIILEEKQ